MSNSENQWSILGAGAVGHLLACRFAQHQIPFELITNEQPSDEDRIVDYHFDDDVQRLNFDIVNVKDCRPIKNLLLAVKAHQVEDAIADIKPYISDDSSIYLLQNGMGTLENVSHLLAGIVAPTQIYPGTNTHGVYLSKNGQGRCQVIHAGYGNIVFGNNYLATKENLPPKDIDSLKQLILGISWVEDIEQRLWLKLAINSAINPLTAINHCLNGMLLDSDELKVQVELLCDESSQLFQKLGIDISKNLLLKNVFDVIVKTAGNQSSMLQDVISRKETEIDFISGYILEKSKALDLSLTAHQNVYKEIKALTIKE